MTTPNKQEKTEQCFCQSYYEDGKIINCTCGKCHPKEENKMEGWVERFDLIAPYEINGVDTTEYALKIKTFISSLVATTRKETLEEVESALPEEDKYIHMKERFKYIQQGHNNCLSQVKDTIKNLTKE